MEELRNEDLSDQFFETPDEFAFSDCIEDVKSESVESVGSSIISELEFKEGESNENVSKKSNTLKPSFPDGLRRRSSSLKLGKKIVCNFVEDLNSKSPEVSEITEVSEEKNIPREKKKKKDKKVREVSDSSKLSSDRTVKDNDESKRNQENSVITSENEDSSLVNLNESSSSSMLVFMAELVIQAISFQLNLCFSFFTFPIWLLYCSFWFTTNPMRTIKDGKEYVTQKLFRIWSVSCEFVSPILSEQLKGNKSIGKFLGKFGWGFFWSVYVCTILFGFLVSGFVIGGLLMRYLVEEPIQFTGVLNFDYTKPKPVALVPLMSCPSVSCCFNCEEKSEAGRFLGSRVIPPNHKLQLTVLLTLPESDYNKKLGVFQVRLEILSTSGRVTDSSRHTSMLRYKSQLITYLETFLKSASLLTGYSSEEQVLKLKMRGFTEGYDPTSCIRVILEQRAEYRPGAGVPEIYGASLVLESELPILKRIIWYWKKTVFIWISIVLFLMQFIMILVCCRPIIIPRVRPRVGSANNNGRRNNRAQTRAS
ncbi:hypothetical protein MKX01_041206 [Papaver californicum]|nr:hypothetical protein MKX01_041206 [Papaver californicum]